MENIYFRTLLVQVVRFTKTHPLRNRSPLEVNICSYAISNSSTGSTYLFILVSY
jgi:hypothetical protein